MNAGFLYVLINASMPDVVKVGKTERDPEGRAKELSGVTGVPTPFVVVYEELFDDCTVAEQYVHTLLEAGGYRVAANREFFSAPVKVAIEAVIKAKAALGRGESGGQPALVTPPSEPSAISQPEPWEGILGDAKAASWGLGDAIQDLDEAARLYAQAAKLGSAEACYLLAMLNRSEDFPGASDSEALKWLNEGARRGHVPCYAGLATLYLVQRHLPNARKCWARYREAYAGHEDDEYWKEAFFYLLTAADQKVAVPEIESFLRVRGKILGWGEKYMESCVGRGVVAPFDAKKDICLVRYLLRSEESIMRGTVRFWNDEREGGGSVTCEDGQEALLLLRDIVEGNPPPTISQPLAFVPIELEDGRRVACVARLLCGSRLRGEADDLSKEEAIQAATAIGLSSEQLLEARTYPLSDEYWPSMLIMPASFFPRAWNRAEEKGDAAQMMSIAAVLARVIGGQSPPGGARGT